MAIRSMFDRLKFWKRTIDVGHESVGSSAVCPELRLANRLKRYEKCVACVQSIIMWDHPVSSVIFVIGVNICFWIFLSLEWRCYGIISTLLLVLSVYDAWTSHIWPEISVAGSSPSEDSAPNTSIVAVSKMLTDCCTSVRQCIVWLKNLRLQQPGMFCCLSLLVCLGFLLVGQTVSGLFIVYSGIMSVLLLPGLYKHCVPPHLKTTLGQQVACVQQAFTSYSSGDTSDDEYMPVTTSEDIALLTRASDLHNNTYDSITNPESSLEVVPVSLMPSHEEDSMGTLSDLEPRDNLLPLDLNEDSDSNHGDHQLEFKSGHYNGDSSSDDSDAFSRDLVFTEDRDETDSATKVLSSYISQAVTSNLMGSVGLLANVIRPRQTSTTSSRQTDRNRRESDSDPEDFEIISREELND